MVSFTVAGFGAQPPLCPAYGASAAGPLSFVLRLVHFASGGFLAIHIENKSRLW